MPIQNERNNSRRLEDTLILQKLKPHCTCRDLSSSRTVCWLQQLKDQIVQELRTDSVLLQTIKDQVVQELRSGQ